MVCTHMNPAMGVMDGLADLWSSVNNIAAREGGSDDEFAMIPDRIQ